MTKRFPLTVVAVLALSSLAAFSNPAFPEKAYLKVVSPQTGESFGSAVAISGKTAVVGAENEDGGRGAVHIFVCQDGQWVEQTRLIASNRGLGDGFGGSVAIFGDIIVVGAPSESSDGSGQGDNSAASAGAAYVFQRNGANWVQIGYLKASNAGENDLFGQAVAISGETIVVGAPGEASDGSAQGDNSEANAGAAYVFVRNGGGWNQQAWLKASNAEGDDDFGVAVAIDGNVIAVGAEREAGDGSTETNNSLGDSGAAYVFTRSGAIWTQRAYLKASNPGFGDRFGASIALDGSRLVVGAPREDSDGTAPGNNSAPNCGASYVFRNSGGNTWVEEAYLKPSNAAVDQQFGWSVAIQGARLLVGAHHEDSDGSSEADMNAADSGAAYVFDLEQGAWTQSVWLKASNVGAEDAFGDAVALSRYHILAGALREDSDGSGPADDSASGAGAAYLFEDPALAIRKGQLQRQVGKAKRKIRRLRKVGKARKAKPLKRKKKRFIRNLRDLC